MTKQEKLLLEYSKFSKFTQRDISLLRELKRFGIIEVVEGTPNNINVIPDDYIQFYNENIQYFIDLFKRSKARFINACLGVSPTNDVYLYNKSQILSGNFDAVRVMLYNSIIKNGTFNDMVYLQDSIIENGTFNDIIHLHGHSKIINAQRIKKGIEIHLDWKEDVDTMNFIERGQYIK